MIKKKLITKIKDKKGGLDQSVVFIVATLFFFLLSYAFMFAEPYFSDKRITEEYIQLTKDMICRQPQKGEMADKFLKDKLDILYGDKYEINYYIKQQKDNWENAILLTNNIENFNYERGDLLLIIFERKNKTYFENILKTNFSRTIGKEGMIEVDSI